MKLLSGDVITIWKEIIISMSQSPTYLNTEMVKEKDYGSEFE